MIKGKISLAYEKGLVSVHTMQLNVMQCNSVRAGLFSCVGNRDVFIRPHDGMFKNVTQSLSTELHHPVLRLKNICK